jgi:LysM repeat protein
VQSQRDFARATSVNLEGKTETLSQSLNNLEAMVRGLTNDLRQIKTQSNDSVTVLGQYKQKISELESLLQVQSQHMQNLEAALQSMMEVWQAKEAAREIASKASESGSGKTYKVQPGDSLEKIARSQKVSVQALREANQLVNDRILVGQTLKIP